MSKVKNSEKKYRQDGKDRAKGPLGLGKRASQERNDLPNAQGLVVEGASVVKEYLRFSPSAIREIWVDPSAHGVFQDIEDQLKKINFTDVLLNRSERQRVAAAWGVSGIQSNAAILTKKTALSEDEGLSLLTKNLRDNECVLLLDHIQDPRNLGAIIRSAAFFDIRHIFMPERRQAPLTSVVASTAQGGLALTQVTRVTNLTRLMRDLKEKGFWILGADMSGRPIDSKIRAMGKIALVLGSEGDGLGHQVKGHCDILVGLPSLSGLDSLNVSVAAGILISQLKIASDPTGDHRGP